MNDIAIRGKDQVDEKIHVVKRGARSVYEVIESADEVSVTIRYAGDRKQQLTLLRSTVPSLADVLKEIVRKSGESKAATGGQAH
jgi:predicted CopG family antitoxin